MRTFRRAMRMPIGLPAFDWMVRIGAPLLMRTDPELALYGRYVVSRRLREEGFEFRFPDLGPALADLLAQGRSSTGGTKGLPTTMTGGSAGSHRRSWGQNVAGNRLGRASPAAVSLVPQVPFPWAFPRRT